MKYQAIFFALFAALVQIVLADTESYTVLANAASRKGTTMDSSKRYVFMELWAPKGAPTDCVSGYAHVRLVVGSPAGAQGNMDFHADAYDLVVDGDPMAHAPVESDQATDWRANSYVRNGELVRVSVDNDYQYLGETTYDDTMIQQKGIRYIRAHPNYNVDNSNGQPAVNCRTYVDWLAQQIIPVLARRSLGGFIAARREISVGA